MPSVRRPPVKMEACEEVAMKFDAVTRSCNHRRRRSKELILEPYRDCCGWSESEYSIVSLLVQSKLDSLSKCDQSAEERQPKMDALAVYR